MLKIGIDPGVCTGLAVWDSEQRQFTTVQTLDIDDALFFVANIKVAIELYVENPNTFIPFKNQSAAALAARKQGAGSVKRDFAIWQRFAEKRQIKMHAISLHKSLKKLDAKMFARLTGYKGKTTVHARDAAMLVFNR
jgi:hypothetical protein